ncbi:MAG: methanol dehydrogenase, partial [Alphaproteobacteria bacterium]|nr:methanol dehydrogenase [Alphaproteobacteria bacterium]
MRFWIVLILLCVAPALRAAPEFPALTGRVVDGAGVLSETTRQELTARLAGHEAKTGNQVAVVTLSTLQGYTIEEFGYQLGRHWGIGSSEKDNGALLIVAPKERKLRIEV